MAKTPSPEKVKDSGKNVALLQQNHVNLYEIKPNQV